MQTAEPLTLPLDTRAPAPVAAQGGGTALPVRQPPPQPPAMAVRLGRRLSRAHWAAASAFLLALALCLIKPPLATLPLAAFVLLCLSAPSFPRWSFFLPILSAGPRSSGAVTLTFDDGPDPVSTRPLLDLLARHGATAAFFVVGERARAHPDLIREILAGGHEIGNHSHTHDLFLALRGSETLHREVADCQEVLRRQGVTPFTFRPPLGMTNSRLPGVLEGLGLVAVCFRCRPLDFGNRRVARLSRRVLRSVEPGDVVLLHDRAPRGGVEPWLREIDAVVQGLGARGVGIVSLSTLLERPVMDRAVAREGAPGEAGAAKRLLCALHADVQDRVAHKPGAAGSRLTTTSFE